MIIKRSDSEKKTEKYQSIEHFSSLQERDLLSNIMKLHVQSNLVKILVRYCKDDSEFWVINVYYFSVVRYNIPYFVITSQRWSPGSYCGHPKFDSDTNVKYRFFKANNITDEQ